MKFLIMILTILLMSEAFSKEYRRARYRKNYHHKKQRDKYPSKKDEFYRNYRKNYGDLPVYRNKNDCPFCLTSETIPQPQRKFEPKAPSYSAPYSPTPPNYYRPPSSSGSYQR